MDILRDKLKQKRSDEFGRKQAPVFGKIWRRTPNVYVGNKSFDVAYEILNPKF